MQIVSSLREERANLSALCTFVRFVLVWICRFPLPLGVWEGLRFVIVALSGLFMHCETWPMKCTYEFWRTNYALCNCEVWYIWVVKCEQCRMHCDAWNLKYNFNLGSINFKVWFTNCENYLSVFCWLLSAECEIWTVQYDYEVWVMNNEEPNTNFEGWRLHSELGNIDYDL